MQGGRLLIRLGDSDIDYDKNFRFYMTSKLSNPHYLPEVCIKVTIINFTVTKSGLEDQLLRSGICVYVHVPQYMCIFIHIFSDVVRLERPDLEKQRNELIVNINKAKTELKVHIHVHICIHMMVCSTVYNCIRITDRALKTPF